MSAPYIIIVRLGHLCAKNYQSWWKFDKVMPKTILTVFLRHGVQLLHVRPSMQGFTNCCQECNCC